MWASEGWGRMTATTPACWGRKRDSPRQRQTARTYFTDTLSGRYCATNWYHGNYGFEGGPHFAASSAPALLGFDDEIAEYWYAFLHLDRLALPCPT